MLALWGAVTAASPVAAAGEAAATTSRNPAALLDEARALYRALEYDRVIPVAEAVIAHPAASVDDRLDAYVLHGSSLAIVGDPIDAEKPFRFLLRGRPDFDLPADTPPKILAVFRKVQVEERAIREQMAELERRRVVERIVVEGAVVDEARGGVPLAFDVAVRDPSGSVAAVSVRYRRAGEPSFSSLALAQGDDGRWRGAIPGEWSESDEGFTLEYHVDTLDGAGGALKTVGSASEPLRVDVAPGTVADAAPFYRSLWFWGLSGVAALTVVGSASALGWFLAQPPTGDLPTVHLR